MLYQFSSMVQFEVFPLNVSKVDHVTQTDWARKEIAGAPVYREWVGEGDEEIHLIGRVFPLFMRRHGKPSGMGLLDILENIRRLGQAHMLMRGDGVNLGWFVIERLSRGHTMLDARGVGQQLDFDATFVRVPVPDPALYLPATLGILE